MDKNVAQGRESILVAANVASVPHYSPFRYPGGKTWLAPVIRSWLKHGPTKIIHEPFAGGGTTSLLAVIEGYAEKAVLYEKDVAVSAVWKTMLGNDAEWLVEKILTFQMTPIRVNAVLCSVPRTVRTLGFQTIIKNRCRRGGVIAGSAGLIVRGERDRGLLSRWYPETLARRIQLIHAHKKQIEFHEVDAMELLPSIFRGRGSEKIFIDPPYPKLMRPGVRPLYTHVVLDHEGLFRIISKFNKNFLLTYDDTPYTRELACKNGFSYAVIAMRNSNADSKKELLIFSKLI